MARSASTSQAAVTIDAYLARVGEFGRFQRWHYLIVAGGWVPCGLVVFSMVFINAHPHWVADKGEIMTSRPPCDSPSTLVLADMDLSVAAEWGLVCDQAWLLAQLNSMLFVGFLVGAPAFGWAADRFGRRRSAATRPSDPKQGISPAQYGP